MRIDDISLLGWLHTLASMVALLAGPAVFAMTKGTRFHRQAGTTYAIAMGIASITALGLFAPITGLPAFNRFHWMALGTLAIPGRLGRAEFTLHEPEQFAARVKQVADWGANQLWFTMPKPDKYAFIDAMREKVFPALRGK